MVAGVEDDGVLGPLEGPGGLDARERCRDLASELLEVAVGAGGLSPAKDAGGPSRHLVPLRSLSREVVVCGLGSVGLRVLLALVVVVLVVPASPSTAAAASTALLSLASLARFASLAKSLEVVAVLGGVGVPVVVDAERAVVLLLGARSWSEIGRASCRERV